MNNIAKIPDTIQVSTLYLHVDQDNNLFCATAPLPTVAHLVSAMRRLQSNNFTLIEPRTDRQLWTAMKIKRELSWKEYTKLYFETLIGNDVTPEELKKLYSFSRDTSIKEGDFFVIRYPEPHQITSCPRADELFAYDYNFDDGTTAEFQGVETLHLIVLDDQNVKRFVPLFLHSVEPPQDMMISTNFAEFPDGLSILSMCLQDISKLRVHKQIDHATSIVLDGVRLGFVSVVIDGLVMLFKLLRKHNIRTHPIGFVDKIMKMQVNEQRFYYIAIDILTTLVQNDHVEFMADPLTGQFPELPVIPDEEIVATKMSTNVMCEEFVHTDTSMSRNIKSVQNRISDSLLTFLSEKEHTKTEASSSLQSIITLLTNNRSSADPQLQSYIFEYIVEIALKRNDNGMIDNFRDFFFYTYLPKQDNQQFKLVTLVEIFLTIMYYVSAVSDITDVLTSCVLFVAYFKPMDVSSFVERILTLREKVQYVLSGAHNIKNLVDITDRLQSRRIRRVDDDDTPRKRRKSGFIEGIEKDQEEVIYYKWVV